MHYTASFDTNSTLTWQQHLKLDALRFAPDIEELSDRQILTVMGYMNAIAFHLGNKHKVFQQEPSGRYNISQPGVNAMVVAVQSGTAETPIATTWLEKYMQTFWQGSAFSRPTLRIVREFLSSTLGLFTYEKGAVAAKRADREPPVLHEINLFRLLLIYEMCETELISRGLTLDDIGAHSRGSHKGNLMRLLYNAVFGGMQFRREEPLPNPEPVAVDKDLIVATAIIDELEVTGDRPRDEVLERCWGFKRLRDRIINLIQVFTDWGDWEDWGFLPMAI